jgi:hypothetical protein
MNVQGLDSCANSNEGASHDGVTPALAAISRKGTMEIPELPQSLRCGPANTIRLEEGPAVLTTETAATAEPNADTNLLNLLIVDDERTVRESCREVAVALGFDTQIADSPEHCYRILDSTNVDVVLLDLRLPGQMEWRYCARSSGGARTLWL